MLKKNIFENIPDELKARPQWVNLRRISRDGKPTKPPFMPSGKLARTDDLLLSEPDGPFDGKIQTVDPVRGPLQTKEDVCRNISVRIMAVK